MTRIRQTSLQAYQEHEASGKMGKQSYKIYRFLRNSTDGYTRHEISRFLGISINAVCGRINELIKAEWLEDCEKRQDRFTKKLSYVVRFKKNKGMNEKG